MTAPVPHIPVLRAEVIAALAPQPGETHIDGTFGAGGYTRALLDCGASVIAIDRDPDAIRDGQAAGRSIRGPADAGVGALLTPRPGGA